MTNTGDDLDKRALELFGRALDIPSDDRAAWVRAQGADDADLIAKVLAYLSSDESARHSLRTGGAINDTLDIAHVPDEIGAYRITELIGRGGMGAVFRGERKSGDFDHDVAIKIVRPGSLSDKLIERFTVERQTLAGLSHPNIARLYDGGALESGEPYIVMEYIDGMAISEWMASQDLPLDQRLALFLSACSAVGYAHQNLIIHRDITPSNVLVDRSGQVKLIDFGIAKPFDENAPPTQATGSLASLSFTPGFAAPERKTGGAANTLSDVYSLGRLLETVLEPEQIDKDLAAIIERATSINPADRYGSVDALVQDLDRFRNGNTVFARNGSASYRFGKFFKRRKLSVIFSALAVGALATALGVVTMFYHQANQERAAADRRFSDVRSLANFMMFDLYDEMEKVSGNTKPIGLLATQTQTYLDSLAADKRASLDISLEASLGYMRLADIVGNPKNRNLGRRAEAGEMLDAATERLEALIIEHPENVDVMRAIGEVTFSNSVHKYVADDDNELALKLAERSVEIYDNVLAQPDPVYKDKRMAIRAKLMSATPLPWIGRSEEGVAILLETLSDASRLAANYPDNPESGLLLGSLNVEVARALERQANNGGEDIDTLPYWDEAVRLRNESYGKDPENVSPYRSLIVIYSSRASALRSRGDHERALADIEQAEIIGRDLFDKDPDDAWVIRMLTGAGDQKAKILSHMGRHDEAAAQSKRVIEAARTRYLSNPDNSGMIREWGYSLVLHAEVLLAAGETQTGCELVASAREIWDKLDSLQGINEADMNYSINNLEIFEEQCAS